MVDVYPYIDRSPVRVKGAMLEHGSSAGADCRARWGCRSGRGAVPVDAHGMAMVWVSGTEAKT